RTMALPGRPMAIFDGGGRTLMAAWNGLGPSNDIATPAGSRTWTQYTARGAWRVHTSVESTGGPFTLLVAIPLTQAFRERREAQEAMWVGIPAALLLSAIGGWWLAAIGLRPITNMAQRAGTLAASGTEDLGHSGRRDELGQLESAFNDLVARLRHSLQTQ